MAPTTTADSNRHRASKREKGRTTAAWEMVNGINKPWLSRHGHVTDLYIHSMSNLDAVNRAPGGTGLQWATVRNLLMAWVLTLPVSIVLAGALYWLLRNFL
jgi:phosphate/sulfate permease